MLKTGKMSEKLIFFRSQKVWKKEKLKIINIFSCSTLKLNVSEHLINEIVFKKKKIDLYMVEFRGNINYIDYLLIL